MNKQFGFDSAIRLLKNGVRVRRSGWNGKGMFVLIPQDADIRYLTHIDMKTADGTIVPWVASHTDMLSEDWEIV